MGKNAPLLPAVGFFYLAVPVVLVAALAAVGRYFYLALNHRIALLQDGLNRLVESRYSVPSELLDTYPATMPMAEMDITGAWAAEQNRMGIEVSDEEIEEQRRMWAAEGMN